MVTVGCMGCERRDKPLKHTSLPYKQTKQNEDETGAGVALLRGYKNLRLIMNTKKLVGKQIHESLCIVRISCLNECSTVPCAYLFESHCERRVYLCDVTSNSASYCKLSRNCTEFCNFHPQVSPISKRVKFFNNRIMSTSAITGIRTACLGAFGGQEGIMPLFRPQVCCFPHHE
eukprot:scaffold9354_cov88-Skeletonema_dohrnii-CCMP3373.AAC.4